MNQRAADFVVRTAWRCCRWSPTSASRATEGDPAAAAPPRSVDVIYERLLGAILEHRLPPGTKLGEERLATVFGVSRTQVRQALARLTHDRIVTLIANRGAFVSSPTVQEAREVFEARRLIEPSLIRQLAAKATRRRHPPPARAWSGRRRPRGMPTTSAR